MNYKSVTPMYRIETAYICFTAKCRKTISFAWDTKRDGKPTPANIKRWLDAMNKSNNENPAIAGTQSDYAKAAIVRQSTNQLVTSYTYPLFYIVS